jgi:hypothetical protein
MRLLGRVHNGRMAAANDPGLERCAFALTSDLAHCTGRPIARQRVLPVFANDRKQWGSFEDNWSSLVVPTRNEAAKISLAIFSILLCACLNTKHIGTYLN